MSTITEKLKWLVEADATSAIKGFDAAGKAADKNLSLAEQKSKKLGGTLTKTGAGAMAFAGIAGGALVKAAGAFEDLALKAGKMGDATGLSVDQASRWIEVSGDMGIGADTIEGAIGKMNKTLGNSPEKFEALNIKIAATKTGTEDVNGTFLNVIARLNEIEDPAARAAAAAEIFGKGWQGSAELLKLSTDDIKTQLQSVSDQKVISEEELQKAKDYRADLDHLKDSAEDLVLAIGQGAAPTIGAIASVVGTAVEAFASLDEISGGAAGSILATGAAALGTVGALSAIAGQAIKIKGRFTDAEGAMTKFGKGSVIAAGLAGLALGVYTIDAQQAAQETANLQSAIEDLDRSTDADLMNNFFKTIALGIVAGKDMKGTIDELALSNVEGAQRVRDHIQALVDAGTATDNQKTALGLLKTAIDDEKTARKQAQTTTDEYKDSTEDATAAAEGNTIALAAAKGATDELKAATEEAKKKSDAFAESIRHQREKLDELYGIERNAVDAKYDFAEASAQALLDTEALNVALGSSKTTQDDLKAATDAAKESIFAASEDYATLNGAAIDSEGGIRRQIESLEAQAATLAPGSALRLYLDQYIQDLKDIPSNIDTFMNLHVSSSAVNPGAPGYIPPGSRGAEGGIIKAKPGGRVILAGEAGSDEALIPLDGQHGLGGGGLTTINIYPQFMPTPKQLANILAQYDRHNATNIVTPVGR